MSRPEALYPLFATLTALDGVGPRAATAFAALRVERPRDLLFTLPQAGIERRLVTSVLDVVPPGIVTVEVSVGRHLPPAGRGPTRVEVTDARATFQLAFFHARPGVLDRQLPTGARRIVSGRVEIFDGIAQMAHPDHIVAADAIDAIPAFEPVYPLAAGLTQRIVARAAAAAIAAAPDLAEWIDPALLAREGWPGWRAAVAAAHAPQDADDLSPAAPARERLAYDEVFAHQLTLALARRDRRARPGIATVGTGQLRARVMAALPYQPTAAQSRAMDEIAADMARPERMNRLLQGDVGSGKTLVALMALLTAVEAGGQGAMMAPTGILAHQHFDGLAPLAAAAGVTVDLLTGRDKGATRAAKLAALARGETAILLGTHALFQRDVVFADLRLAVVDEQHRFGVGERLSLGAKGDRADVLVMTATPIPRSLALTHYGEMDVSVLDEKPPGRQPVRTALVSTERIGSVVERLRTALAGGQQAYWVCPLVDGSEASELTAAQDRFAAFRLAFGADAVGLVHGRMAPAEKDAAMARFAAGQTGVLVATTVIEVGVNVPAATIMVVERAEGFGLAQLHQLRGRVGRGAAASTCVLLYQPPLSESGRRRLEILRRTEDGFVIAEEDLAMRGAGDLIGHAQSGLPRFRIVDLERQGALLAVARRDVERLLHDDPGLGRPRGCAARVLLWLMEQDRAIRLLGVG